MAIGFSIGTKGYLGTGYNSECIGNLAGAEEDLWEWDQSTNVWTQKADLPLPPPSAIPRYGAVGFSIGTKGYVSTGFNGGTYFNDLWEYTP